MTNAYAEAFCQAVLDEEWVLRVAIAALLLWVYGLTMVVFADTGGAADFAEIEWAIQLMAALIVAEPYFGGLKAMIDVYRGETE